MAHIVSVKKTFNRDKYAALRGEQFSEVQSKRSSCLLIGGDDKVSNREIAEVKINSDRLSSSQSNLVSLKSTKVFNKFMHVAPSFDVKGF